MSVSSYYLGSEIDFRPARTIGSMLEVTHIHLPIMAIVVLLLTHLMIFAPYSNRFKIGFISVTFASALLGEASGWLVRLVHPGFAYLKIAMFLTFQLSLGYLLIGLGTFLYRSGRSISHAVRPTKKS